MIKKKKLRILGRDLFGIKPLYFSVIDEGIVFSSEILAIKKVNLQKLNIFSNQNIPQTALPLLWNQVIFKII